MTFGSYKMLPLSLIVLSLASVAQNANGEVNVRQQRQHQRIAHGAAEGSLTRSEARSLRMEQKTIREEERAYRADGLLNPVERRDLRQDQNQASQHIYNQRHDAQGAMAGGLGPGTRDPGVNQRQYNQRRRIAQGIRSGELTHDEAHALREEEGSIRAEERSYKTDGQLTRTERRDLHQDLHEASRDIYAQKHDDEQR